MTWTKELIKEQTKDRTPYTDDQIDYLVRVLNSVVFPWTALDVDDVQLKLEPGAFGDVFTLYIGGLCYMTTSAPDLLDHRSILEQARGDILLTGLGLGVGILLANLNENVTSITVIENHPLILKHIGSMIAEHSKVPLTLIEADANEWVPDRQYDFTYIDHSYERADESNYAISCKQIVSWWDERQALVKTWQ